MARSYTRIISHSYYTSRLSWLKGLNFTKYPQEFPLPDRTIGAQNKICVSDGLSALAGLLCWRKSAWHNLCGMHDRWTIDTRREFVSFLYPSRSFAVHQPRFIPLVNRRLFRATDFSLYTRIPSDESRHSHYVNYSSRPESVTKQSFSIPRACHFERKYFESKVREMKRDYRFRFVKVITRARYLLGINESIVDAFRTVCRTNRGRIKGNELFKIEQILERHLTVLRDLVGGLVDPSNYFPPFRA